MIAPLNFKMKKKKIEKLLLQTRPSLNAPHFSFIEFIDNLWHVPAFYIIEFIFFFLKDSILLNLISTWAAWIKHILWPFCFFIEIQILNNFVENLLFIEWKIKSCEHIRVCWLKPITMKTNDFLPLLAIEIW